MELELSQRAVRAVSYGFCCSRMDKEAFIHFIGGALGGTAGTAITCPLEVIVAFEPFVFASFLNEQANCFGANEHLTTVK